MKRWFYGCPLWVSSAKDEETARAQAARFDEAGYCHEEHRYWKAERLLGRDADDRFVIPEGALRP